MRNKVVLIRGFGNISPKITLAAYERINADHVVLMAALRFPQFLPEDQFQFSLIELEQNMEKIMWHWEQEDHCHILAAEYAHVVLDRGGRDVKAVEGKCLKSDWFYETVRSYHRHFGQTVIDCKVIGEYIEVDGVRLTTEQAVSRLSPHPSLG
jgi:hypothetical protein